MNSVKKRKMSLILCHYIKIEVFFGSGRRPAKKILTLFGLKYHHLRYLHPQVERSRVPPPRAPPPLQNEARLPPYSRFSPPIQALRYAPFNIWKKQKNWKIKSNKKWKNGRTERGRSRRTNRFQCHNWDPIEHPWHLSRTMLVPITPALAATSMTALKGDDFLTFLCCLEKTKNVKKPKTAKKILCKRISPGSFLNFMSSARALAQKLKNGFRWRSVEVCILMLFLMYSWILTEAIICAHVFYH